MIGRIQMKQPYVIAINAVSGGGKTAVAQLLTAALPKAVLFSFDHFDDSNVYPPDFNEWAKRGANLEAFDCPGMAGGVAREIAQRAVDFIVMDYPFGRDHPRFRDLIDLSVFIDTPLDVAMARRISRDLAAPSSLAADERLNALRDELTRYAEKSRLPYLAASRLKVKCDLILNGMNSLEGLRDQILEAIHPKRSPRATRRMGG